MRKEIIARATKEVAEVVNAMGEAAMKEVAELLEKNRGLSEAESLPDKIGGLSEAESLPDKMDLLAEHMRADELSQADEGPSLQDDVKAAAETDEEATITDGVERTADVQENGKMGGSYKVVKREGEGGNCEVHHMPADSASPLERGDGPAIKMDKSDHRETASCGRSREAQQYREKQRELISQGKFREALQLDIDDIREKFGEKYDDAIKEMLEYVNQLEKEGKI